MTMKYAHIINAVRDTPWAILPGTLATITDLLWFRSAGGMRTADEIETLINAAASDGSAPWAAHQGATGGGGGMVGVIPLVGVIMPRGGELNASGSVSLQAFGQLFGRMVNDPAIGSIVLDIDSPGGSVAGVDEMSSQIFAARGTKPIIAVANHMAASAAFFIGTAADELVVTPSSEVGSIGIITAHEDHSAELAEKGIKVSVITAGKFKGEGHPFAPLDDEARAAVQSRVDEHFAMFIAAVARNRGVPRSTVVRDFGEGRMVGAREAVKLGMADRVATLDATLARLAGRGARSRGAGAMAGHDFGFGQQVSDEELADAVLTPAAIRASVGGLTDVEWTDEDEAAAMAMQPCDGGRDCDAITELLTDGVPVCADCRALDALDVESADLARRGRRVG